MVVRKPYAESPVKVYNFEVEDFHTYFVGENGIFVHNWCGDNSWNDYQNLYCC
ncbi:polymorphic toxin-type HINT domain-containing protein [uncultured Ruminococcus sp.]|uniref:polymorphic toxin-type HINT domain-containing protein n=1 Tax=uncultured Ruminococcus sp. TaxID=165186 RepID=UPI0025E3993C|nr:polymorphic toxin-type HINT domain-containing protein [uncultured Ruminococcus sp.]